MQKSGQNVTEDPDSAIPRDTTKFLRLKLDNLGKEKSCNMWGWGWLGLRSAKLQMNPLRWICTKILIVRDLSPAGFPDSDWVFLPSSRRCVDFGSTKINTEYDQSMAPAQMR